MNLYRVTLRGMGSSGTGTAYGISYVVAKDTEAAYSLVRKFLDEEDIGFKSDRVLDKIELLAQSEKYPDCRTMLFMRDRLD